MKNRLTSLITVVSIFACVIVALHMSFIYNHVNAEQEGKPSFETREDIPLQYKWNLQHIYKNETLWTEDVKSLEQLATEFEAYQGTLSKSKNHFIKVLTDYSEMMRLMNKVYVYAKMNLDVASTNSTHQLLTNKAQNTMTLVNEKTAWLAPEITMMKKQRIEKYLNAENMKPYRVFVNELLREKDHTLSQDIEKVIAQMSPLSSYPQQVYSALTTNIKFPTIPDEDGKEVPLTRANFVSYMENEDRNVRKAAFETYYDVMESYQDTLAQTLAGTVKAHNINATLRGYPSALQASLSANNIPVEVYDNLIKTVHEHLPLLHRYMELKKRLLKVDELHMYDLYTPIGNMDAAYIPYVEAQKIVKSGLKPMGDDVQRLLDQAFTARWIDVYSTVDKRSGAYQWGTYDTHPFVLLNYQGTLNDVYTIAHELGHAMHSYYSNKTQPYMSANYPIFTAEVASTLNETLLFQEMYKKAKTNDEKVFLLHHYLESFRGTLFRQAQFAEFEKVIHEKDQAGEALHAEALKKLYAKINQKYYGDAVISDEEIAMEWARVPHFYYNFYVYQYATSFAASAALSKHVMEEGDEAVRRIKENLLSAGNSKPALEVLKATGVDMSSSKPIEDAMKVFEDTLNELEKLITQK